MPPPSRRSCSAADRCSRSPRWRSACGRRRARCEGFRPLVGDFGLIDLDADSGPLRSALKGVRVFAGYAGWGYDQLQEEIREGSWFVVPASPTDLLHPEPDTLWRSVLRRQPGELAFVATFPDDPMQN